MRAVLLGLLALLGAVLDGTSAAAHALDPGYLELRADPGDGVRVNFTRPNVQGRMMPLEPRFSTPCEVISDPPPSVFDGRAWATTWQMSCPGGLAGITVEIEGLSATRTDVLIRYELTPGEARTTRVTAAEPRYTFPEDPGRVGVFVSYFGLGLEHIAFGLDHLLFVFALLLLIRDPWTLLGAVTAFTLAHSITLAAAALGWTQVPGPPVEAIIALSIMFLAAEIVQRRPDQPRLSERAPWLVAFGFGLIHGLGFGSALQEIGLPSSEIVVALLAFNLGVEAGQVLFILAVLALRAVLRPVWPEGGTATLTRSVSYGIGSIAAFWFVERLAGF